MGGWGCAYATEGELSRHVRVGDTADDAQLALAIETASRAIDARCRRQFGQVPVVEPRLYTPRWSRSRGGWLAPIDDLMTSTGLVVKVDQDGDGTYETTTGFAYAPRPYSAVSKGHPWTELFIGPAGIASFTGAAGSVQVTARWGWSGVPDAIRQACLLQASRLLARRDAPFGVAGSPETGSELRLLARLDPDVVTALEPYRRRVWAA